MQGIEDELGLEFDMLDPDEAKTLLHIGAMPSGNLVWYIDTDHLTPHQYALVVHDMIRVGAMNYGIDPEKLWHDFDIERVNPEVENRIAIHRGELVIQRFTKRLTN